MKKLLFWLIRNGFLKIERRRTSEGRKFFGADACSIGGLPKNKLDCASGPKYKVIQKYILGQPVGKPRKMEIMVFIY